MKFVPIKTTHSKIPTIPLKGGQMIFTQDRGEGYIDYSDTLRLCIGTVVYLDNELDRLMLTDPTEYKLYYVEGSDKLYSYIANTWKCLNPEVITNFTGLTDVPNDYSGMGGMELRVKSDETGLEFVSPKNLYGSVNLAYGVYAYPGKLLAITANGYVLADRSSLSKINDIVLSLGTGTGTVKVLESGYYSISGLTPGSPVYLGTSGNMTCSKPGTPTKIIGYAISSTLLKFKPDSAYR